MQNVIILFDGQEYRVPAPDASEAGAYYTDDREDAMDTFRAMWKDIPIEINILVHVVLEFPAHLTEN